MIKVLAPAKINLFLQINGNLPGGFHDLSMLMQRISLSDEISLEKSDTTELIVDGENNMGVLEKNLAYRAAKAFFKFVDEENGVKIKLKKIIPTAAGLGGGSSDAAAVLRGMNVLFEKKLSVSQLSEIAQGLGSDVPFFCYEEPAFALGRGEKIKPVKLPEMSILIANPNFPLSTPMVYKKYDELLESCKTKKTPQTITLSNVKGLTRESADASLLKLENASTMKEIVACLYNDLEPAAQRMRPEINVLKESIQKLGANGTLMSGSGPTVFGIFENDLECKRAADELPEYATWAVKTLSPGAENPVREG